MRLSILILEDQAAMRAQLRDFLQAAYPAALVAEAANAEQALAACRDRPPHVVLMDIGLPDGDGISLTARIRAMRPAIQVVIVSHYSALTYVERAFAAGAGAYVAKESVATDLLPALARLIGGQP